MTWAMKRTPGGIALGIMWTGTDDELDAEIVRLEPVERAAHEALTRRCAIALRDGERGFYHFQTPEYEAHVAAVGELDRARKARELRRERAEELARVRANVAAVLGPEVAAPVAFGAGAEGAEWGKLAR